MSNPYVNPYPTNLPDIREAVNLALQQIIQSTLGDLNAALNRDGLTPMSYTSAQVVLGDPHLVGQSLICVIGGGRDDSMDMEIDSAVAFAGSQQMGFNENIYTEIRVYIHDNEMPSDPTLSQAAQAIQFVNGRELAMPRICGHLRKRIFNNKDFYRLNLTSREHVDLAGSDYDRLTSAQCTQIKVGELGTDYAGANKVYVATLLHFAQSQPASPR